MAGDVTKKKEHSSSYKLGNWERQLPYPFSLMGVDHLRWWRINEISTKSFINESPI